MNELQWLEELYRLVPEKCSKCERRRNRACFHSEKTYDEICLYVIKRKKEGEFEYDNRKPHELFGCFKEIK